MHFIVPPKAARWPICMITGRYAARAIWSIAVLCPHPRFRFTLTRCLDDDIRCDIIIVKRISAGGSQDAILNVNQTTSWSIIISDMIFAKSFTQAYFVTSRNLPVKTRKSRHLYSLFLTILEFLLKILILKLE